MLKKILGSVATIVAFLAVFVTVVVMLWERDVSAELTPPASAVPLDWSAQIRGISSGPPGLQRFGADSVLEGNAAVDLYSLPAAGLLAQFALLFDSIGVNDSLFLADSAALAAATDDATLRLLVDASRKNDFNSIGHISSLSGGNQAKWVVRPEVWPLRQAVRALLVRSEMHLRAAENPDALADVAAVLRLGDMIYRKSAVLSETLLGGAILLDGAGQLRRYAIAAQDTAAFETYQILENWAASAPDYRPLVLALSADVERTTEIVRDVEILPAWRGLAVEQLSLMQYRPKFLAMGIPASVRSSVATFRSIADPRVAFRANLAENSIDWFNGLGVMQRTDFLKGNISDD